MDWQKPIYCKSKKLVSWEFGAGICGRKEKEIRRKIPASKHYIVYPEEFQGKMDLNTDMRRKTRLGRRWGMALGFLFPIIHVLRKTIIRVTHKEFSGKTDFFFKKATPKVFT